MKDSDPAFSPALERGPGSLPIGEGKGCQLSSFQMFVLFLMLIQWIQGVVVVTHPFLFAPTLPPDLYSGALKTFMVAFTFISPAMFFLLVSPLLMWSFLYTEPEVDSRQRCSIGILIHLLFCDIPWFAIHVHIMWVREWAILSPFHVFGAFVITASTAIHVLKSWFYLLGKMMKCSQGDYGMFGGPQGPPGTYPPGFMDGSVSHDPYGGGMGSSVAGSVGHRGRASAYDGWVPSSRAGSQPYSGRRRSFGD